MTASSSKTPAAPPRPSDKAPTLESLDRKLDTLIGNVGLLFQDNEGLHARLRALETQRAANVTSDRVRGIVHETASKTDLEQARALAEEMNARKALALEVAQIKAETKAQTVMLQQIKGVGVAMMRSKLARSVVQAVGTVAIFYLAHWLGVPLPMPPLAHPAPAVTAPAPVPDAGAPHNTWPTWAW